MLSTVRIVRSIRPSAFDCVIQPMSRAESTDKR